MTQARIDFSGTLEVASEEGGFDFAFGVFEASSPLVATERRVDQHQDAGDLWKLDDGFKRGLAAERAATTMAGLASSRASRSRRSRRSENCPNYCGVRRSHAGQSG